jgi:hypothetical protein
MHVRRLETLLDTLGSPSAYTSVRLYPPFSAIALDVVSITIIAPTPANVHSKLLPAVPPP